MKFTNNTIWSTFWYLMEAGSRWTFQNEKTAMLLMGRSGSNSDQVEVSIDKQINPSFVAPVLTEQHTFCSRLFQGSTLSSMKYNQKLSSMKRDIRNLLPLSSPCHVLPPRVVNRQGSARGIYKRLNTTASRRQQKLGREVTLLAQQNDSLKIYLYRASYHNRILLACLARELDTFDMASW
jgi:hypothetical protein